MGEKRLSLSDMADNRITLFHSSRSSKSTLRPSSVIAVLLATCAALAQAAPAPRAARMDFAVASCSWDRPGLDPFMGEVVPAIDRYVDIPTPVRQRLKERMQARRYDDLVDIRRDRIEGRHAYEPRITEMHFGTGKVCREVSRAKWTDAMHERGLVYCDSGHCILVPTVCRNVSRIVRAPERDAAAPGGEAASSEALAFDPPGAGVPEPAAVDPAAPVETATSSFAEAVMGDVLPLWPGLGADLPGLSDAGGGFGGGGDPAPGFSGGSPPLGGGGFNGGGGAVLPPDEVLTPVPEPATWAAMLSGLLVLALVRAHAQRRTGAPRCATQKRS
jgi:hypothetical protein